MKRFTALAVIAVIAVLAIGAMTTSSAHAGGQTIDGLARQDVASCTSSGLCSRVNYQGRQVWAIPFYSGNAAFGAHVIVNASNVGGVLYGNDLGTCVYNAAPTSGYVVDGTVHPWTGEPQSQRDQRGNPKYIPPCTSVPHQQPPAVAVVLPPAMKMQQFGQSDMVIAARGVIFANSGAVYMNCYTQGTIAGWVLNGTTNQPVPYGTGFCGSPVGRWK